MNKIALNIVLIILCTAFSACEDEGVADTRFYTYAQTQCADPWGNTRDEEELKSLAETYLVTKDIEVIESTVSAGEVEFCFACSCLSGKVLTIELGLQDGQKLLDLDEGWEVD